MDKKNNDDKKIQDVHQLLQQQKVKAATLLLQELSAQRPADPKVLTLLGAAALKQQDFNKAKELLEQALVIDDSISEAHFNLATLFLQQGHYDKAIEQYQQVSTQDASHKLAQMNLALAFENKWRFKEAQIIYEKMLLEYPQDLQVYLHLGNVLVALGKINEAIHLFFERGLDLAPKSIELLNQLGVAYQRLEQNAQALKCFHKVLAIKPDNVQALFHLSQQYTEKDELFPEIKHLQELCK